MLQLQRDKVLDFRPEWAAIGRPRGYCFFAIFDQEVIEVGISVDQADLLYRYRKCHLIHRCAECDVAAEESSELCGIIAASMSEPYSAGLLATIGQLSAYANERRH